MTAALNQSKVPEPRLSLRAVAQVAFLVGLWSGCSDEAELADTVDAPSGDAGDVAAAALDRAPAGVAPPLPTAGRPSSSEGVASGSARRDLAGPVCAPCLTHRSRIDARSSEALERCEVLRTGLAKVSRSCGVGERTAKDLERFVAAAPALDPETRAHVLEVFERGQKLGRDARVFGLVGDSITVSSDFLGPFAKDSRRKVLLSPWATRQLTLPGRGTVIDYFQRGLAARESGDPGDPFSCYRAARVGASASWAIQAEDAGASPVAELVTRLNPAFAVVTFGANDAVSLAPPEEVADQFEKHLLGVVKALEERGVVAIVSNEMRHGDQPGVKACPRDAKLNDWRIAVATNANIARAAQVACRDHLPFIDLRHALDAATNFGLGEDGVHLTTFQGGAGVLDEAGLDCGNNIRNLVTLLALRRVVEALELE